MARKISEPFLQELNEKSLKPILEYVKSDDSLNMELRGETVKIYYRGGKLLTIQDNSFEMESLDEEYHKGRTLIYPTIENIEDYIPKAKRVIDRYVVEEKNHLWEKEIQQRIVQENNFSKNSLATDFFIIDTEYQSIGSRADIVALLWHSTGNARKLPKSYRVKITIFELKQGFGSIDGYSGMSKHFDDFNSFIKDNENVTTFKQDMVDVFKQKRKLGLIRGMEPDKKYGEIDINMIADDIEFVFILANYDPDSSKLTKELSLISDCKFIYANPMGYGLYAPNIISKKEFIALFLCKK